MYRQNSRFSQMKDKKPAMRNSSGMGMKNSGRIAKTGINVAGRYRSGGGGGSGGGSNRMNRNFTVQKQQPHQLQHQQHVNLPDVSKLKQLCTVTNEWIQQKSSELLDVLRRDNSSLESSQRTVTLQGRTNTSYGRELPSLLDRNYNDNNFQRNRNSSDASSFNRDHFNKSHPTNMNYEQNRERYNQQQGRNNSYESSNISMNKDSFDSNRRNNSYESSNISMNKDSFDYKSNSRLFSLIEKLKLYVSSRQFTPETAPQLFVEASQSADTNYNLDYTLVKKTHSYKIVVEKVVLGSGRSMAKRDARLRAYDNTLNRLRDCSVTELIDSGYSDGFETNKMCHQINIQCDTTRPISALVILETQQFALMREKRAMPILRRSVYLSKMDLDKKISSVGNVHKVTILVQKKPVGMGLGKSLTKASNNAAADALFNNFYRNNPILQSHDDDDSKRWIPWSKIKFLAQEMGSIGGHSLIAGQDVSNRCYSTAIQRLVDNHPWTETDNELIFGPGMPDMCVRMLYCIAKERNLNIVGKKESELSNNYYVIQHYYDPMNIVRAVSKHGGRCGKYRLVSASEIPEIQCDHWEPISDVFKETSVSKETRKPQSQNRNRGGESRFGNRNDKPMMAMTMGRGESAQMANNNGRFDQSVPQDWGKSDRDRQMSGDRGLLQNSQLDDRGFGENRQLDDGGFGQMRQTDESRQTRWRDNEFGQMHRSDEREFAQMSRSNYEESNRATWHNQREINQLSSSNDREFRGMQNPDERVHMERGMSDNFDREFIHDRNKIGYGESFNSNPGYSGRDFNQMSDRNERELDSRFRSDGRDVGRSYGENNRQISDERYSQNRYENNRDALSRQSDIGLHQQSNYDRRFNENLGFDRQVSNLDNGNYNQQLNPINRDFERGIRDDRQSAQALNYDERRMGFNNDQLARMDRPNSRMIRDEPIDSGRMQMQDQRGDARMRMENSRMHPPQMPHGPSNKNMMMQNVMNQAANKNQLTALRFLTKKIADTALHVNVKGILANARRLSSIARARSQMEKSTVNKGVLNVRRPGRGMEPTRSQRRAMQGNRSATSIPRVSQNSKVTKKPTGKQPVLNKSSDRKVPPKKVPFAKNPQKGKATPKKS